MTLDLAPAHPAAARDARAPGVPTVSVVIPCYNYGRYLAEAIASVQAQTHPALEIIVIDDGSTDDTAAVAAAHGDCIRYYHQRNGGLPSARNLGLQHARGELVTFLDADDIFATDYLEATVAALCAPGNGDVAFAYTQMELFGRDEVVTEYPHFDADAFRYRNIAHASSMIRRRALGDLRYDDAFRVGWEDWDLYLGLVERGFRGCLVDRPLLRYRKHEDRGSQTDALADDLRIHRLRLAVMAKHRKLYGTVEYHGHVVRTRLLMAKLRLRRWRRSRSGVSRG